MAELAIFGVDLAQIPVLVSAVGALGFASMGIVDAAGKALLVFDPPWLRQRGHPLGLPYAGYAPVLRLVRRVAPALRATYGESYGVLIADQYRADRGASQAPDMIRQGVRLGLPYVDHKDALAVVEALWGLPKAQSLALATALTAPNMTADPAASPGPAPSAPPPTGLAARFATALDTAVQAAFDAAEQSYQAWARFWAGVVAVALSLLYHWALAGAGQGAAGWFGWVLALITGLAAVPLAPVAKDLSSSLSQALSALGQAAQAKSGG
jgi:hypothetical protein